MHTILPGQKDQYVIGQPVGHGGVGTVYRARATASGRDVAIKVLHGERFGLTDAARARMKREIVIATEHITSDYVVVGLDHGVYDENDFLVMEWMAGGTLSDAIATGDVSALQKIRWIAQLLKGFRDVRDAGFIHRDIKTNNVMLSAEGVAKLADLGLARSQSDAVNLTLPGDWIGSLLYISERQRREPSAADSGDDFYSLCVVMYEMISSRRFHTRNPALRTLKPTGIPVEILQLVDWGIEQQVKWQDVFAELEHCIDLNSECVNDKYSGSLLCPIRIINRRLQQAVTDARRKVRKQQDEVSLTLMDQMVEAIEAGFEQAVERIADSGLRPGFGFNGTDCIAFSTALSPELYSLLKRVGEDVTYEERGYGWLSFESCDGGIKCLYLNGKRLAVNDGYLPADWHSRVITECNSAIREWLHRLGYGLAIEAALSALEYASELVDIGFRENEKAE